MMKRYDKQGHLWLVPLKYENLFPYLAVRKQEKQVK